MVVLINFLLPQEGVRHEEPDTTLYINDREVGKGTLYVTESLLSWVSGTTGQGFSLEYPNISLHAISRDQQLHPHQYLYVMVDAKLDPADMQELLPIDARSEGNDEEDDDDESETPMTEMRFVPENSNSLDAMFQAMSQCQALHPDPQEMNKNFTAEEDIYEDAEDDVFKCWEAETDAMPYILASDEAYNQNGADTDEAMDIEAGQFEDAEEDP
ncbi:methylosome subunit pICln isoform X1 [Neodiprion pinetum]|uniref:Methylosome subunit pICln n=1 Tax=Neodiprion lecontei TaxID=441921 RepID=A0ABM3GDG3_NEOLC|nr:methylosome subunit pICln isoform X1 [Neodiprion fabricii]XP_046428834.1 methylosome subunit pICln isoform X1 [Neodiprion fabricii]XP_046484938.1 methylosome subunit pICln isoform X1 [Neodiprion pinetum]XP_046484939.1 methylosome subunit pICln isoform X1 [Neodiprion pinetum]XP_046598305.1 methylosome subunit pICln isoform X1 [Neodiprion lecontei]